MIKKLAITAALTLGLAAPLQAAGGGEQHIENFRFSFEGPFGTFDQAQLQRGFQIYTEVCSACHGLQHLYFRNIADEGGLGYSMAQARAYAAQIEIYDAELDDYRPATPADHFPAGGVPNAPDLTLMAKARAGFHGPNGTGINQILYGMGGAEYIASLLDGYTGEEKEEAGSILYENTAFPGGWVSMAPPLFDEAVEFADGHANDVHHMAQDVAAFLMWAAEPRMMARKEAGFVGVIFLSVLSVLLYLTNKALWAGLKGRKED